MEIPAFGVIINYVVSFAIVIVINKISCVGRQTEETRRHFIAQLRSEENVAVVDEYIDSGISVVHEKAG